MIKYKLWLIMTVGALGVLVGVGSAQAANNPHQNDIGFNVAARIPDNQIKKHESFFDLKMNSGQTETIATTIYNTTDHEITVEQALRTTYTNNHGEMDYVTPAKVYDPSLKYKLSELAHINGPHTVTIPAYTTKVVTTTLNMPRGQFNGVLLGGWYFKRINDKVTGQVRGATNVQNEYSYSIGIKCTLGTVPVPQMKLGTVKASLFNYHRDIEMHLRNVSAVIIPDLTLSGTIFDRDSGEVIKNIAQKNVQMAPNSDYSDPLLFGKQPLRSGHYHLAIAVKNTKHYWHFERDFTITAADAQRVNNQAVDTQSNDAWKLVLMGSLGTLLIIIIVWGIWLGWHRWRKQQVGRVGDDNLFRK